MLVSSHESTDSKKLASHQSNVTSSHVTFSLAKDEKADPQERQHEKKQSKEDARTVAMSDDLKFRFLLAHIFRSSTLIYSMQISKWNLSAIGIK